MKMQLDEWQREILQTEGNIVVRSGRQVGKSTIISIKAAEYAVRNKNKQILVVSATERQAFLLFSKILMYLDDNYRNFMKTGKDRPTKSEIKLKNGSVIRCLPTGLDGLGIRGFTTNMLIADEAHFIPEAVWEAVTPQLVTTEAIQILISTTHGREGYFYRCFQDDRFKKFHVTTEDVAKGRPEPMRSTMLDNVNREKERMTKLQFAQEYLGEFVDDLRRLFPDELIKSCLKVARTITPTSFSYSGDNFLGVDVARMGEDDSVFASLRRITLNPLKLRMVGLEITKKTLTTETTDKILALDKLFKYKRIYIDDGGLGVAVFDPLLKHDQTKRRVVPINNATRYLDRDETRKTKLMKEVLYFNLLNLMERGQIELYDDDELVLSLSCVQYEYMDNGDVRIFGNYTHIAEALIRAAWCSQEKSLNLWCR